MEPTTLQIIWFLLLGVLLAGYAVLDGFDLGVGVLSMFRKDEHDRRLMINAIGPVWDGNEVWLITAGGALFAAFPPVYASVFSGFYLAFMLFLVFLIARAVAMEFRGKVDSAGWRRFWDWGFGIGSFGPALLYGVAVGNIMRGIPLDADGNFTGTFLSLLNPFALLMGLTSLGMFTGHGALYMAMKSEGDLAAAMKKYASRAWVVLVILYLTATVGAFFAAGHLFDEVMHRPLVWVSFGVILVSLIYIPIGIKADKNFLAFLASSSMIVAMIGIVGACLYPRLVPAINDPNLSLTIANASSTPRTLMTMFVIALLGMPVVIIYTVFIYRVFKGKVHLDQNSY